MGNEAGDLDSIVSALCMAFLITAQTNTSTIPYVQFPRADFQLRPDAVLLFQSAGFGLDEQMAPKCLTFSDELSLHELASNPNVSVVLTDHNELSQAVAPLFGGRVV